MVAKGIVITFSMFRAPLPGIGMLADREGLEDMVVDCRAESTRRRAQNGRGDQKRVFLSPLST